MEFKDPIRLTILITKMPPAKDQTSVINHLGDHSQKGDISSEIRKNKHNRNRRRRRKEERSIRFDRHCNPTKPAPFLTMPRLRDGNTWCSSIIILWMRPTLKGLQWLWQTFGKSQESLRQCGTSIRDAYEVKGEEEPYIPPQRMIVRHKGCSLGDKKNSKCYCRIC